MNGLDEKESKVKAQGVLRPAIWVGGLGVIFAGFGFVPDVQAMPNFARQYGYTCNVCHTIVPRLNKTGYDFRRAGFRMPDEIGERRDFEGDRETADFKGANYFSARIQANLSWLNRDHTNSTGAYDPNGGTTNNNSIEFKEFTIYPLTGGFLGNWAAESEISGSTDEIEVENAYVRYARGNSNAYWQARLGIFHPFEGYGASDRPISISRPLIQSAGTVTANGDENGWHPWGFDQAGIESGFAMGDTSVSVAAFNGLIENAEDPAQGGDLEKAAGSPSENDKDYQLFVNQFFGESEAAISLYYYDGRISLGNTILSLNRFRRAALYGSLPLGKVNLLGAYSWGQDRDAVTRTTAENDGWFLEVDGYLSETLGIGARYDQFDPSDLIDNNNISAVSVFLNMPANNGLQWIAEYKHKRTEHPMDPDQEEDSVNVRTIFIW
ncbi:MAG: hypothetical protein ACE5HU_03690 [Acidobacteriota bacterium]